MSFPYNHVLLVGATSGIGKAMADRLISEGVKVTAVGRRKDRLDEFIKQHGSDKASGMVLDISEQDDIPKFAEQVIKKYPTVDCIFLNAGIQRRFDWSSPSTLSLSNFHYEVTANFTSFVNLTHAFLPHFLNTKEKRGIIYTGTHLSLVPVAPMSAYSASKAALDAFIMCVREQLKDTNVKVVHLSPPPVQTELHDAEMGLAGRNLGMPVSQFTNEAYTKLAIGTENIIIGSVGGSSKEQFMEIVSKREKAFERLGDLLRSFAH